MAHRAVQPTVCCTIKTCQTQSSYVYGAPAPQGSRQMQQVQPVMLRQTEQQAVHLTPAMWALQLTNGQPNQQHVLEHGCVADGPAASRRTIFRCVQVCLTLYAALRVTSNFTNTLTIISTLIDTGFTTISTLLQNCLRFYMASNKAPAVAGSSGSGSTSRRSNSSVKCSVPSAGTDAGGAASGRSSARSVRLISWATSSATCPLQE
jgi:hypothetical protein